MCTRQFYRLLDLAIFCISFSLGFCSYNHFQSNATIVESHEQNVLNGITSVQWNQIIGFALQSRRHEESLERNILNKQIIVKNNTMSHRQFLDSLPNIYAQQNTKIAQKILSSSLYIYNSICSPKSVSGDKCEAILSGITIPMENDLARECTEIIRRYNSNYHHYRRLLSRNYKDGFYQMFDHVPQPLLVSQTFNENHKMKYFDKQDRNLVFVQWTQFVEHDLSKPVVTSMSDGSPIECCDRNGHNLQLRYRHPACAPLSYKDNTDPYGPIKCLTYVRSAISVGKNCTFAAREQLNQATSKLDLSQLYGVTLEETQYLRTFKNGLLKSSSNSSQNVKESLFLIKGDSYRFCADKNVRLPCFLSGDSRVNHSPLTITIYTLFLRNHNRLARYLKSIYSMWDDETLFQTARSLNVQTYLNVVLKDWLGQLLGHSTANNLVHYTTKNHHNSDGLVSNEFGVAAIRFYQSMLADSLITHQSPSEQILSLSKEIYKPSFHYSESKLHNIMMSLLQQRAMNVDTIYENSFRADIGMEQSATRTDALAFDIQRNRDHGLQSYVKYLEICENINISDWLDLIKYIPETSMKICGGRKILNEIKVVYYILFQVLIKLKSIYGSFMDIDLIVGGISEIPLPTSVIGPTFHCIIAEQFEKLPLFTMNHTLIPEAKGIINTKAFDLLCINFNLQHIPKNIFQTSSDINPLVPCSRISE